MIEKFDEIIQLFNEIDLLSNSKIDLFLIGGAAMMRKGLKSSTKDIDIVVRSVNEFNSFKNILLSIGFNEKSVGIEYKRMNISKILTREDFRIDLFYKTVCDKLCLSDKMSKRSSEIIKFKNITLNIVSNEDIIIFKSMTERQGDLDDTIELVKSGVNWDIVLEEIKNQIKISGNFVWITWIGERFEILEEKGIKIPIMKDIIKIIEEFYDSLEN